MYMGLQDSSMHHPLSYKVGYTDSRKHLGSLHIMKVKRTKNMALSSYPYL